VHIYITQTDIGEEDIVEARIRPSTKMHVLTETQLKAMEIEMCESDVATKKRHAIMDKATLMEEGIYILDPKRFIGYKRIYNYDKHVERMENWKDINEEEYWVFKARLIPLFLMIWEAPMPSVMLEFLNIFIIKGTNIYFGHKDKVYVISKQLIGDVFGVCAKGYVEDLKG